jgi:hypothetical protein
MELIDNIYIKINNLNKNIKILLIDHIYVHISRIKL